MSGNWFEHTLRRTGWRPQRQAIALATLGLFIALIIGALYLSQVANEATMGRQLEELVRQRNALELSNEQLRAEIANLKSLGRLQARARELGFETAPSGSIEYMVVDGYNPNRGQAVVPPETGLEVLPVYDETFDGWLQQQWDALRRQFEDFGKREES